MFLVCLGLAASRADETARIENRFLALNYPRLQGIGPLDGDGSRDRLLHATLLQFPLRWNDAPAVNAARAEARTTLQGQLVVIHPLRPGVPVPTERMLTRLSLDWFSKNISG